MRDKRDDFWDIAALLPKKKNTVSSAYGEVTPVEISVPGVEKKETEDRKIPKETVTEGEERVYTQGSNPFILRVRVIERKSHIHLFHAFKSEGALWLSERGKPTPYVPFFSFLPQYYQLNAAQRAYYLYFRDEANAGRYHEAGPSYVLLYIFEIINLPSLIDPKIGVLRLANVWAHYRDKIPALDKSMVAWFADYALLHNVPCPHDILRPFLDDILAKAPMKEFYLAVSEIPENTETDALLLLTSAYKYQNSRYAAEHKSLFYTHIPKVAEAVLRHIFLDGGKSRYKTVTARRACYTGALWADSSRYELEVEYYSITGTDDLKILMTSVIKYAENKLRSHLAIKSRLAVPALPAEYRTLIDTYFSHALPVPAKAAKTEEARPAYEALYEPASVGISEETAASIERDSWENTWRLIPEEEKNEIFAPTVPVSEPPLADTTTESGLSEAALAFLACLTDVGDAAARSYAKENGLSYLTLGEEINEYFSETLGDVVLLLDGDRFTPISDYENEIREALASRDR